MVHRVPLDSGLELITNYLTIVLRTPRKYMRVHFAIIKHLALKFMGLSEENTLISDKET